MKKIFGLLPALLLALAVSAGPAEAAESGSADPTGKSCSVTVTYAVRDGQVPIDGAVFAICRVASLADADAQSYRVEAPFRQTKFDPDGLSEEDSAKAATRFVRILNSRKTTCRTQKTNTDGVCYFGGLAPGIYVVWQTESVTGSRAEQYSKAEPFLVLAPGKDDAGQWITDVTVSPKSEAVSLTRPSAESAAVDSREAAGSAGSVKTGDSANPAVWFLLGAAALLTGTALSAAGKKKGERR